MLQFRYFLINVGAGLGQIIDVWAGLSAQQFTFGLTALSYLLLSLAFLWGFPIRKPEALRAGGGILLRISAELWLLGPSRGLFYAVGCAVRTRRCRNLQAPETVRTAHPTIAIYRDVFP
ncbi:hypothetical protein [Microbulbifer sp.]|uniref:hypothetical protein n=1 Tax=Microbulbifer sp. TaxID=1908541 RepID=UPI003F3D1A46